MVRHQRDLGVQFAWVGADGDHRKEPTFLRGLDTMGEVFVVDVHKDQRIYVGDPKLQVPAHDGRQRERPRSWLQAQTVAQRADERIATLALRIGNASRYATAPKDVWRSEVVYCRV